MSIAVVKSGSFRGHDGPLYSLETGMETNTFYSGGSDKVVSRWDINEPNQPVGIASTNSVIYCIRLLRDKNLLVVGVSGGGFHVIDLVNKKELRFILHHPKGIFDILYLQKQNRILTAGADGSVALWSADTFELLKSFPLTTGKVRSLVSNSDETLLAFSCGDGTVRIFDSIDLTEIKSFTAHKDACNVSIFHPTEKLLITGGKDAHLRIWNEKYELIKEIPAHNYAIYSLAFSPDSSMLATASRDKTIKLWSTNGFEILKRIDKDGSDGHIHSVNKVVWLNDGSIISCGDDRNIFRWTAGS